MRLYLLSWYQFKRKEYYTIVLDAVSEHTIKIVVGICVKVHDTKSSLFCVAVNRLKGIDFLIKHPINAKVIGFECSAFDLVKLLIPNWVRADYWMNTYLAFEKKTLAMKRQTHCFKRRVNVYEYEVDREDVRHNMNEILLVYVYIVVITPNIRGLCKELIYGTRETSRL